MNPATRLLIFLLPVWAVCCAGLSRIWLSHPQYAYGWSVPILALYFIWRRSEQMPEPEPPRGAASGWAVVFAFLALLPALPLRVISEANLDWRPPYAALMMLAIFCSGALIFHAGGLPWLRRLAFPLLFPLCALPWPAAFERDLTHALSGFNAGAALETLAWAGVFAVRQGNVIHTVSGSVGVEEACSGIRSLQTCFMLALCFGELLWTRPRGRVLLFLLAPVLAMTLNLLRTLTLVLIVSFSGPGRLDEAHDPVANIFMLLQIAATWGAAFLFERAPEPGPASGGREDVAIGGRPSRLPLVVSLAGLATALAIEASMHLWFVLRERQLPRGDHWEVVRPEEPGWEEIKLSRLTREILGSDSEVALRWRDARGFPWFFYGLRWAPGNLMAIPAKSHSPEICLTGRAGMRLEENAGVRVIETGGLRLAFDLYRFEGNGTPWQVLFGGFEDRGEAGMLGTDVRVPAAGQRLRWAWEGRRNRGFTSLEFVVGGPIPEEEFLRQTERYLAGFLRRLGP